MGKNSDICTRMHNVSCVCCGAAYLEAASFGGVQNEELFEQVLTVGGHVERNPVFSTQHALSQFLEMDERHEETLKIQRQTLDTILFYSHILRSCQREATSHECIGSVPDTERL